MLWPAEVLLFSQLLAILRCAVLLKVWRCRFGGVFPILLQYVNPYAAQGCQKGVMIFLCAEG